MAFSALLIFLVIGYIVSAANAKSRRKDSYHKTHELPSSSKQTYVKPHKKAEIDFSSSEFTDSSASDDAPDDANSEKGTFHQMMVCFFRNGYIYTHTPNIHQTLMYTVDACLYRRCSEFRLPSTTVKTLPESIS